MQQARAARWRQHIGTPYLPPRSFFVFRSAPLTSVTVPTPPAIPGPAQASAHVLSPTRRRILAWLVIGYSALYCGWLAAHIWENTRPFQEVWFLPLWLAAGVGALAGAATPGIGARERLAWRCIGWGWILSLTGDVLDTFYRDVAWIGPLSDLLYTSFYPLLLVGFLLLAAVPRGRLARLGLGLEVAILATAAIALAWYYVWSLPGAPAILARHYATGIWPLAEILILATAGAALSRDRDAPDRQARDLIGAAALISVVADLSLVVLADAPLITPARQVVAMLMAAGATAYACAGLCARQRQPRASWNVAATLPYTAITLVAGLLLFEVLRERTIEAGVVGLAVGAVVLTVLVIVRLLIAERSAAHEASVRIAQERRFRALVQESSDATLVVDATGVIRYASESCARVFGVDRSELREQPLATLIPGRDALLRCATDHPTDGAIVRWESKGEAGSRHLETVVSDLRDQAEVAGVVLTTRDVTERVELERKLVLSQKLDALGLLAGGVAHDINNLLMTVQVNAELLGLEDESRASPELREIERATQRGAALCRQLLVFGRPDAGVRRHLELGSLVRELQPMLRRALPSQIVLDVQVGPPSQVVHIDRAQVESALINVVMNARDAIRAEGCIRIIVGPHRVHASSDRDDELPVGEYVRLSVIDDGSGMDEVTLARAFEPFFTTKGVTGTGLGLAAVYGTMKALGGLVRIESAPGRGSTVHLDFPASARAVDDARPSAAPRPGRGRLLLVEDEVAVRTALERSLARSGYDVVAAADGVEALGALERLQWEVDAIVSDLSMPRMNGATLCARVRDHTPTMPFVLMSGYASPALGADAQLPADIGRLSKPFKLADLVSLLTTPRHQHPPA